jgi:DNA-binding response OmpR family regulator
MKEQFKRDRVLVVERERSVRDAILQTLGNAGFQVSSTDEAEAGIRETKTFVPDLVIINRKLIAFTPENAYLRLRRSGQVLLLVMGDQDKMVDSLESGADAFMVYPPDLRELAGRVKTLLRRKPLIFSLEKITGGTHYNPDDDD